MSASTGALSSQAKGLGKGSIEVNTGKESAPRSSPAGLSSNGEPRQESANPPRGPLGGRMVLQHQQSCPSLSNVGSESGLDDDIYGDGYSNSTPVSPFHLSLDDEFPDFLFDSINDEYPASGRKNVLVTRDSSTVNLEDILRDYDPAATGDMLEKGYNTDGYIPEESAGQYADLPSQQRMHHPQEKDESQRLLQQQMPSTSMAPVSSNVSRPSVSPQLMIGQRPQIFSEEGTPVQLGIQANTRSLRPGNMSPQHVIPSSIGLSLSQGMSSYPGLSPQQGQAVPAQQIISPPSMPHALSPRANTSAISPRNPYPPQQGMPPQHYGQMLASLAARQNLRSPNVPSNSTNLQDVGSPEMAKSRSPGQYVYRSLSHESPQESPVSQRPAQSVFKIPHGSPPAQKRNQKVIQESVNSPSYALQFQDMSLNSPRPRSDTVEMGSASEDGSDSLPDRLSDVGKSSLLSGHGHGALSPTLSDVSPRFRSGTIEMSDSNTVAASSYSTTLSASLFIESRSRAGTYDMLDAPSESIYSNSYATGGLEQRARSGTVEMSDESPGKPFQFAPTFPLSRSVPPLSYVQPLPVSRSNLPLSAYPTSLLASGPEHSQVPIYASSGEPLLLPPQVLRMRQQAGAGRVGPSGVPKSLSHVSGPPGDLRRFQRPAAAQQILAPQRQNSDPGIMEGRRSLPVLRHSDPVLLQDLQSQHYLQQQQQDLQQQQGLQQQQVGQSRLRSQQQQQQQQRILMQQAQQQYKHELEVEQEVAQEFLQEQLLKEGGGGSTLGHELDNLASSDLFGYMNSNLDQELEFKHGVNVASDYKLHGNAASSYSSRQTYAYGMAASSPRPLAHEPIIIMPDGSGFSDPGQYVSRSGVTLPDKEDYASAIADVMEQVQSKQETPFQKLRRIAEDISSCVDDVVKFKGRKDEPEYKYLEETLQRQLQLLEKVQAASNDLRSARKALVKEVQELLEILERRST